MKGPCRTHLQSFYNGFQLSWPTYVSVLDYLASLLEAIHVGELKIGCKFSEWRVFILGVQRNGYGVFPFADCGFSAHSRCSEKVPPDCRPDLKTMRGVFGLDLTLITRAQRSSRPWVVDKCIAEIERRGLTSEGLYRVSGFQDEIASLKLALDKGGCAMQQKKAAAINRQYFLQSLVKIG